MFGLGWGGGCTFSQVWMIFVGEVVCQCVCVRVCMCVYVSLLIVFPQIISLSLPPFLSLKGWGGKTERRQGNNEGKKTKEKTEEAGEEVKKGPKTKKKVSKTTSQTPQFCFGQCCAPIRTQAQKHEPYLFSIMYTNTLSTRTVLLCL